MLIIHKIGGTAIQGQYCIDPMRGLLKPSDQIPATSNLGPHVLEAAVSQRAPTPNGDQNTPSRDTEHVLVGSDGSRHDCSQPMGHSTSRITKGN